MIPVARLNGKEYYLNPHLIEVIEETPDTVITLTTGKKVAVAGSAAAVVDKVLAYQKLIRNSEFGVPN